jgi:hypothetical protein
MKVKIMKQIFLILFTFNATAQEWKVDLAYKYIYSNQLDKAIQTYNYSRPFLAEQQALLMHGLNTTVSYIFKNEKSFKHGFSLSYSYIRSSAENENFKNTLHLNLLNLGYLIHYENIEKWKGFYSDITLSATTSGLFRNLNGKAFIYDETKSKAFGIGGEINLKLGYAIKLKNKGSLSPFLAFAYTPYLFAPNNEAVINQTKGLINKNWTGIVSTQIGFALHLEK